MPSEKLLNGVNIIKESNDMARVPVLSNIETHFLIFIPWLEHAYNDTVQFLDVDFDTGNVQLWGLPEATTAFRKDLGVMLEYVRDEENKWRYI